MKLPVVEASETLFKQYTKLNMAELNGMLNRFEKSIVGKTLVNSGLLKVVKVPSKAFSTIKHIFMVAFRPLEPWKRHKSPQQVSHSLTYTLVHNSYIF